MCERGRFGREDDVTRSIMPPCLARFCGSRGQLHHKYHPCLQSRLGYDDSLVDCPIGANWSRVRPVGLEVTGFDKSSSDKIWCLAGLIG